MRHTHHDHRRWFPPRKLTTRQLRQYDMLIAADICFWDELVDPVYKMVNRAVKAGVKLHPDRRPGTADLSRNGGALPASTARNLSVGNPFADQGGAPS